MKTGVRIVVAFCCLAVFYQGGTYLFDDEPTNLMKLNYTIVKLQSGLCLCIIVNYTVENEYFVSKLMFQLIEKRGVESETPLYKFTKKEEFDDGNKEYAIEWRSKIEDSLMKSNDRICLKYLSKVDIIDATIKATIWIQHKDDEFKRKTVWENLQLPNIDLPQNKLLITREDICHNGIALIRIHCAITRLVSTLPTITWSIGNQSVNDDISFNIILEKGFYNSSSYLDIKKLPLESEEIECSVQLKDTVEKILYKIQDEPDTNIVCNESMFVHVYTILISLAAFCIIISIIIIIIWNKNKVFLYAKLNVIMRRNEEAKAEVILPC